jgi:hypothetical protein
VRHRGRFSSRHHKRSTDWQFQSGTLAVNGSTGAGSISQDWVVPPFGDGVNFPDLASWTHATVVKNLLQFEAVFVSSANSGRHVMGLITCPQNPANGGVQNLYSPIDDAEQDWLIRVPFVSAGAGTRIFNCRDYSRLFLESSAQRKLSDGVGLAMVVGHQQNTSDSFGMNWEVRTLMKLGAGGSLA